jgi:CRISPR-associated protein (TIGR03986 family)
MQPLGARGGPKDQTEPFLVDGKLRLPGAGLRGMVRTLVEILGMAPLWPVNDQQLFFRAVGATDNPRDRSSFEPQAKAYWDQIGHGASKVEVGYLYGSTRGWQIQPAFTLPNGEKWLRIHTTHEWKIQQGIWFKADGETFGRLCTAGEPGAQQGCLVCSGRIPPKRSADRRPGRKQWLIPGENPGAGRVDIPEADIEAYEEAGKSQEIEKHPEFVYSRNSRGTPCFFVRWKDHRDEDHISFGHTPYFRLPYVTTTEGAIPNSNQREKGRSGWDLAQAIFGRIESGIMKGQAGRVRFEDALLVAGGGYEREPAKIVLGTPKPTTYQHYLVQPSDSVEDAICWDGDYRKRPERPPVARGHKLYWHRPGAPIVPGVKDKVSTSIQVAHKGTEFKATLHFENLVQYELGVLLTALQLPADCAHHLGMGKPLGLGSFRLEVTALREIDRAARYASFRHDAQRLNTGFVDCTGAVSNYQKAFAVWYINNPADPDPVKALWVDPRLRELRALLTFGQPDAAWNRMTRYLELGKLRGGGTYNEYQYVGYPARNMSKRRPLPPATQVREGGPEIPRDAPPDFDRPDEVPDLRTRSNATRR